MPAIIVQATQLLADSRGLFIQLKVKGPSEVVQIAVSADINSERLFRILGKYGVPLATGSARKTVATKLQREIEELCRAGKTLALDKSRITIVEMPLM